MLPSEKLRLLIEKLYNIDLKKYAWSEDLQNTIFQIELDHDLESNAHNLEEIYKLGYNIGHCGLTSRYVTKNFDNSELHFGTSDLLVGTKNALEGEHAWSIINGYLIDTTLMLCIPIEKMDELGYKTTRIIDKECASILSEYDVYDNDFSFQKRNPNYQEELMTIKNRG